MPSSITHAYIGLKAIDLLNKKPKDIINNHINNYKVYCQNMDVLYFYHILLLHNNIIQKLGHKFHNEHVYKSFELLITDNKKNKDTELFTFIAGLITHYIADSTMHPYIDFLAHNDNKILQVDKHFEIETYIDNYYIKYYINNDYKKYNNSNFIFNYTKEQIIIDEINKVYKKLWNYDNMGIKYYKALKEMHFIFKYIRHDNYGIKKNIYKFIDINPFNIRRCKYLSYHFNLDNDNYYLNLNHTKWFNYHKKDYISNKSFIDLMNDVTKKSAFIINNLYEYIFNNKNINLKELVGNNSYATGLPIEKE